MSPSLKYLMVWSIAARNASSDPMSLTATLGVEVACVLLVMCGLAPDADRIGMWRTEILCSERAGPTWPGYDLGTPRRLTRVPASCRGPQRTARGHSAAFRI